MPIPSNVNMAENVLSRLLKWLNANFAIATEIVNNFQGMFRRLETFSNSFPQTKKIVWIAFCLRTGNWTSAQRKNYSEYFFVIKILKRKHSKWNCDAKILLCLLH